MDGRLFDNGCALFFAAALDQPLLAVHLMIAMQHGPTKPDSAAPRADVGIEDASRTSTVRTDACPQVRSLGE